ncbi:hypothetical protein PG997_013388 [Apiospora hydei]|uniref:Terpene cyclase/mutase family member n=1 Tax=Apiospora hydei TaxID=1337664 RepID=A0ABR1V610_9PEZI
MTDNLPDKTADAAKGFLQPPPTQPASSPPSNLPDMVTTRSNGVAKTKPANATDASGTIEKSSRKRKSDAQLTNEHSLKVAKHQEETDISRWRCLDEKGRLTWRYLEDDDEAEEWPQSYADKWFLGLDLGLPDLPEPTKPIDSFRNGLTFFEKLQLPSGTWGSEYGGPMFLLPGIVFAWYCTKTPIPWYKATAIKSYLKARANPDDGGWGLHIEGESTVFGTAMNYTVLRLLGVDADEPFMVKARGTLHKLGGATHGPHWSKFWLSVLGVSKWDMVNPIPPEIWLLPDWVPIAPWRWWLHIRQVFMSMGYIYSKRWVCEETEVIRELRKELFVQPWESIDWFSHRNSIADIDNFHPKSWLLNTANWFLANIWNPYLRTKAIADKAEAWVSKLVDMEDANTDYADLAPVNAAMNTVLCYIRDGPGAYSVRRHVDRLEDALWVKDEGLLCNGTNGVQSWDTAFAIQAVIDAGLAEDPRWRPMLTKALEFLDDQQIRENVPTKTFAIKTPGYPQLLDDQRIFDAVDTLLTYQNPSGGCASYEPTRGSELLEMLNAAEVFENIMVEYDYVECSTAVITALSLFNKYWPDYRTAEIKRFKDGVLAFIKRKQYPHGGWYGNWGICFTYATMFALESLASIGETYATSSHAKKGCEFLISNQREDGGWSESYRSCENHVYTEHPSGSQVVMTAWALIALIKADYPDIEPLKRGIKLIMDRQCANGEWKQEAIEGVFNKSCMILYQNYKFTFPLKALGMFAKKVP